MLRPVRAVLPALLLFSASSASADSPRIFGGEIAEVGDVPALAMITVGPGGEAVQLCTGALVAPRWVLTAAHCTDEADNMRVLFDRMDIYQPGGRVIEVDRVFAHPDYRSSAFAHDVALLYLAEAVDDREALPIELDPGPLALGTSVDFAGYGADSPLGGDVGRAHLLNDRPTIACEDVLAPFGLDVDADDVICFDQQEGKGICGGDSGGPVLADVGGVATIVAINSFVLDPEAVGGQVDCAHWAAATRTDSEVAFLNETLALEIVDEPEDAGCGCQTGGRPNGAPLAGLLGLLALGLLRRRR